MALGEVRSGRPIPTRLHHSLPADAIAAAKRGSPLHDVLSAATPPPPPTVKKKPPVDKNASPPARLKVF
jgi:hypothetical protein